VYSILTPVPTTPISTKVTTHVHVLHFLGTLLLSVLAQGPSALYDICTKLAGCIQLLRLLATSLYSIFYGFHITWQAGQPAIAGLLLLASEGKVRCCSATIELNILIVTKPCTECCLQSQLRASNAGSLQTPMQPYASHRCCSFQAWCKLLSNRCIICNLSSLSRTA